MPKKRVIAYIDGFNVYHSINKKLPDYCKWLDYRKILESLLQDDEELKKVYLFTAYPEWNIQKVKRHTEYMRVLSESYWIEIILWSYKEKSIFFKSKNHKVTQPPDAKVNPEEFEFKTHEEKETDVNIAIYILRWALLDEYDTTYIVTADSDISPAVQMSRKLAPHKKYNFVFPFRAYSKTNAIIADKVKHLTKSKILESLLPMDCPLSDWIITCPYKKPESFDPS